MKPEEILISKSESATHHGGLNKSELGNVQIGFEFGLLGFRNCLKFRISDLEFNTLRLL